MVEIPRATLYAYQNPVEDLVLRHHAAARLGQRLALRQHKPEQQGREQLNGRDLVVAVVVFGGVRWRAVVRAVNS